MSMAVAAKQCLSRAERLASVLDFLEKEGLSLAAEALRVETEADAQLQDEGGLPELLVPLDLVFEAFEAARVCRPACADSSCQFRMRPAGLPRPVQQPVTGKCVAETVIGNFNPTCVAAMLDAERAQLVVGTAGRELAFFSLAGEKLQVISDLPSPVLSVACRGDLVVAGCMGGELAGFRWVSGNFVKRFPIIAKAHGSSHVVAVQFSPARPERPALLLSQGRDGCVAIFETSDEELRERGRVRMPGGVAAAAWLGESEIAVADSEIAACEFEMYEISDHPFRLTGKTHMHASLRDRSACLVSGISGFFPGDFFVAAVGKNVHVYRRGVDGPVRSLFGASEGDGLVSLEISCDGAHVYVGTSAGVGVYETHSGHRVGEISARLRNLCKFQTLEDGEQLAVVAFDKKLRIFSFPFCVKIFA